MKGCPTAGGVRVQRRRAKASGDLRKFAMLNRLFARMALPVKKRTLSRRGISIMAPLRSDKPAVLQPCA